MWQGKLSKNTAWQQSTHAGNGRKRIMGCQEKMQVTFWHITYGAKTWSCIPHQQTFSIRLQTVLLLAYLNKHISTETPNCFTSHIQVNRRCAHPKHQPVAASLACRPIDTANQREISWMNRIAKCLLPRDVFIANVIVISFQMVTKVLAEETHCRLRCCFNIDFPC